MKEIELRFYIKFNNETELERVRKFAKRIENYIKSFSLVKTVKRMIYLS